MQTRDWKRKVIVYWKKFFDNRLDPLKLAIQIENEQIAAWSGATVRDLQLINWIKHYDSDPGPLDTERLRKTVSAEYQGLVHEAESEDPDGHVSVGGGSATTYTKKAEIIAIDAANVALVMLNATRNYDCAEDWKLESMPKDEAFTLLDNYRASHNYVKEHVGEYGLLPCHFDYSKIAGMPPGVV